MLFSTVNTSSKHLLRTKLLTRRSKSLSVSITTRCQLHTIIIIGQRHQCSPVTNLYKNQLVFFVTASLARYPQYLLEWLLAVAAPVFWKKCANKSQICNTLRRKYVGLLHTCISCPAKYALDRAGYLDGIVLVSFLIRRAP